MRATFTEGPVLFYDTLRHWAYSVEQMGEYLGRPKHAPPDFESRKVGGCPLCHEGTVTELCARCVLYCQTDSLIVWEFCAEMLRRYQRMGLTIHSTLPSMALQHFQRHFYRRQLPRLPEWLVEWFRHGYYGGRVEVFTLGEVTGPLNHYDVNSLYPSVMRGHPYPDLSSWKRVRMPDFSREGMATLTLTVPETDVPCLPYRHDDEILYPYGTLTGTWPYPEIRQAVLDGAVIDHVEEAVEFSRTVDPFTAFVEECYAARMRSTTDLDRVFFKLLMNALYGKFGQGGELVVIANDEEQVLPAKVPRHANVIWSAYVTSYARLRLLDYLRMAPSHYTDTDSLFTAATLPVASTLGALKLEGVVQRAEFVGNKLYLLYDVTTQEDHYDEIARAKGVPRKRAGGFVRTGRAVYRKPARFRESRRSFLAPNVWYQVKKTRSLAYTKRRTTPGGRTEPWNLATYCALKDAGLL